MYQGMADLVAMDLVPEPTIIAAAMRACRRVNDFSLTTRILEITKVKCGDKEAEFWPYIMQVWTLISEGCSGLCILITHLSGAEANAGRAGHSYSGGDGI